MMKNNIILVNFLDMISNRSQFLSEKIKFLTFKTIKEQACPVYPAESWKGSEYS